MEELIELAMRVLGGPDERDVPQFADEMPNSPAHVRLDQAATEHERPIRQQQDAWLRSHALQ